MKYEDYTPAYEPDWNFYKCEFCARERKDPSLAIMDIYIIDPNRHCRNLWKSRRNRNRKNIEPTYSVF